MQRWLGRVAVVTGCSSGIGAAIAYQLQDAGVHVVGLARGAEKIPAAVEAARRDAKARGRTSIGKASTPGKLHAVKCDLMKEEDIIAAFKWVKENAKGVDILVNNAGVAGFSGLAGGDTKEWQNILNVNVLGLSICTREAVQQMKANGVDDGHIVHISSVAGHIEPMPHLSMYFASKHGVRVLTEGLRKELVASKSKLRVTEVSPGLVETPIFETTSNSMITPEMVSKLPHLQSEDVADAVLYAISTPPHVQIHEIMMRPTSDFDLSQKLNDS